MPNSWKPEFKIDGAWYDNAIRFASEREATLNALDKLHVWTIPTGYRATQSDDPVNYRYVPIGEALEHTCVLTSDGCLGCERRPYRLESIEGGDS